MKKFTAILVVLCMVIGMCPCLSLAEASTITAVRTGFFNHNGEWKLTDNATGSDNILVSTGGPDVTWTAASSFTDTDGTVTSQSSLSGTGFLTARNGLIAFALPDSLDTSSDLKVTLSMTVKNVKQVSSGARLAVYGNSVDTAWSTSNPITTFGVSGNDSGLSKLPLLGLTSAIQTGNSSGETASGETITLSSFALTEYIKEMAEEGKSEVTFRLASPLGGVRIYDNNTQTPPTLTIEEGTLSSVKVKTVLYNGEEEVESEETSIGNIFAGSVYTYTDTPKTTIVKGEDIYVYSAERSTLSVTVASDGSSEVILAYEKQDDVKSFYGYEIEDEGAWCWFGDPRAINFTNDAGTIDVTVIGYIDVHGSIKATQINNLTNKVDEVLIRTNIQPDDHNNPTFVMIPDGRIVVFYSRHTDEACFWYRVSEKPGDITTFGEEKCLETSANTTYPSPFILSDDPDHIYLCWRGIEWHPTIAKLSLPDENGDMEFTYGPYQIVRSTNTGNNVRPYAKYASNGKDKIFMSYTSTHPDNVDNNWLYFNQIDINTMTVHNINGDLMRTIDQGPLIVDHSNQSHIVDKSSNVRNWLWQVAVADDGYPVIANVRINGGKTSHDYYYVKWNGSEWVKTFLTNAGGKFHPSNTEYCYSGGMSIDVDNPNIFYVSKPVDGVFGKIWEIFKYTMSQDGTEIVSTEQITQNSLKNNVRPWVIPNSEGKDLRVMWMNGDYDFWMVNSVYPAGYPTRIMGEVELPKEEIDLEDYLEMDENYDDIGGVFVSTKETANQVGELWWEGNALEFTVSTDIYLNGDYEGEIFDLGNVQLSVQNLPTKYGDDSESLADRPRLVLTVNGVDYLSPNVYGTSDEWKNHNIRTGGEYFFTRYDEYINLTLVSDGEYMTVYRDGLVDIKVETTIDDIKHFTVGGFDGYAERALLYIDRALNHDEIKALSDVDYTVATPDVETEDEIDVDYLIYGGASVSVSSLEKIKPTETVKLYPGTDVFKFEPEEIIVSDGVVYTLVDYEVIQRSKNYAYAVYRKNMIAGENLVPDGDFTDDEGNFSWGTWQSPETGNYFADTCNDWFYMVNRDTNASALYQTGSLTADDYALGTRWNDGTLGLCSMANFIEVEAGKTYYVSYDYKHQSAGADAAYISTDFVSTKSMGENASGNNIPVSVSTTWQTNEFAITAEEDGYIYFHFSWLGNSNNAGNGPYWYFDNFTVCEVKPEIVIARISSVTSAYTVVNIENTTDEDIEGLVVYAAEYDSEGTVVKAEKKIVDISVEQFAVAPSFDVANNVKVFIWDENMTPVHNALEGVCENSYVDDPEAPVMVVTKIDQVVRENEIYTRITGVTEGATVRVIVNPDEAETLNVEVGNVILYSLENGFASDIRVLFKSNSTATADGVEEGLDNILSNEFSDEAVSIHYGEITDRTSKYVVVGEDKYYFAENFNVIVVDYTGHDVVIEEGTVNDLKESAKYTKTVFVKTIKDTEDEISDAVVFISSK